jgi:septal ring factor EnvC (AmiA/AmiB activator)
MTDIPMLPTVEKVIDAADQVDGAIDHNRAALEAREQLARVERERDELREQLARVERERDELREQLARVERDRDESLERECGVFAELDELRSTVERDRRRAGDAAAAPVDAPRAPEPGDANDPPAIRVLRRDTP